MSPSDVPILTDLEGLLTTAELCEELGIKRRALYDRWQAGRVVPAGRAPGKGDRGSLYWHPPNEEKDRGNE